MTPQKLIQTARIQIPTLSGFGAFLNSVSGSFGGDIDPKEVRHCARWIKMFMRPRKTVNQSRSSYGLKHSVERWAGHYVANGAFIAAAVGLGYRFKSLPDRHSPGPNVCFHASYTRWDKEQQALRRSGR